jgi:hypothetical protein
MSPWTAGTGWALCAHLFLPLWPPQCQCLMGAGPSPGGPAELPQLVCKTGQGLRVGGVGGRLGLCSLLGSVSSVYPSLGPEPLLHTLSAAPA